MSACVVFIGPTLPSAEASAMLPNARILPPVRHGDLLRLDVGAGDMVLIIDGLFLQAASVRHREIMYLLQRGVIVTGSSSMGALRAAELWRFGMRGFGEVFRLYRDGEIDGDDEVAIVHGTAEDGYHGYSDPLVSIRIALRDAARAGALLPHEASVLLGLAIAMPFRSRSFRALDAAAGAHVPAGSLEAFRSWRSVHDTDAKAADARVMLAAAAAGDPALRPAGVGDQPVRNVHTTMFEAWEHEFHGGFLAGEVGGAWVRDADAAAAIRLTHPRFREHHRRQVLSRVAGVDPDHPALAEYAVAAARARGLAVPGPEVADCWLTPGERALPMPEALVTLLVRAFGVTHGKARSRWDLPAPLRTPAVLDWANGVVVAARGRGERLSPEFIDQALAQFWGCDVGELEQQAWDRGIASLAALRQLAAPFAVFLRSSAVPVVPDR